MNRQATQLNDMTMIEPAGRKAGNKSALPNVGQTDACVASGKGGGHQAPTRVQAAALTEPTREQDRNRIQPPALREDDTMSQAISFKPDLQQRARILLARVRQKQLETAQAGRILDSARYAARAQRIRTRTPQRGL